MSFVIFKLQWKQLSNKYVFFVWAPHAAGLQCRLVFRIKALQRAFIKTNTTLPSSVAGKDILGYKRCSFRNTFVFESKLPKQVDASGINQGRCEKFRI